MVQAVSQAVKDAFDGNPVKWLPRILIEWIDFTDITGTVTANEFDATYFPKEQGVNGVTEALYKPFILGDDTYFDTEGASDNMHLLAEYGERGWLGSVKSDVNGDISPTQSWSIIYDATHSAKKITISGARFNYPVDFDLYYRNSGDTAWVLCDNYSSRTSRTTVYEFGSATIIKGLKIDITKISATEMYPCLVEAQIGFKEDISSDFKSMKITKQLHYEGGSIDIGNISANRLKLILDNTDQRYNPLNENSDIYSYLRANKRISPYIGIEVGGSITYIPQGVFYISEIKPRPNMTVEIEALDRMALLNDDDFASSSLYTNQTISQLVTTIAQAYGLASAEYNIEVTTDQIPFAFFNPARYAFHLKQLAIAEAGYAFFDEENLLQFKARDWGDSTVRANYDDSEIVRGTPESPYKSKKMKNFIKVKSRPLVETAQKVVFTLSETIIVSAGETITVPCYFYDRPVKDVQSASITKHANITLDTESKYIFATYLVFTNSGGTDEDITAIEIEGKPIVEQGVTLAEVKDSALITEYGNKIYEIDLQHLQSYGHAETIGASYLASWKDPEAEIVFKAPSKPYLQLGDLIGVNCGRLNLG